MPDDDRGLSGQVVTEFVSGRLDYQIRRSDSSASRRIFVR